MRDDFLKIGAVILAGGQARRMGGVDKGTLKIATKTTLECLTSRLSRDCEALAINIGTFQDRYPHCAYPRLRDPRDALGPLGGIAAAVQWGEKCGFDAVLTIPVDTPFIPKALPKKLSPAPAYASYRGCGHFLVALWPIDKASFILRHIEEAASSQDPRAKKIVLLLEALGACAVDFAAFADRDPFMNINTQNDLQQARRYARLYEHG